MNIIQKEILKREELLAQKEAAFSDALELTEKANLLLAEAEEKKAAAELIDSAVLTAEIAELMAFLPQQQEQTV